MIALLLLGALGPCADLAQCTARVKAAPELQAAVKAALTRVRLPEGEPKAAPQKLEPKVLRGDVAFTIEVEAAGEELLVRAVSQHRAPSIYGLVKVKPQPLSKPKDKAKALEIALRGGIERAMENLSEQLSEAAGQGKRTVRLSVKVNGLDLEARRHVVESFFPCLKGQFDALGAVTEPHEVSGYLEDVVDYVPTKDEPRDSLQWQANRLRATTVGEKAQCHPPAKYVAKFSADEVGRGVLVELR